MKILDMFKKNECTTDDIDWDFFDSISETVIERARNLDAHFPIHVRNFENGVTQVS